MEFHMVPWNWPQPENTLLESLHPHLKSRCQYPLKKKLKKLEGTVKHNACLTNKKQNMKTRFNYLYCIGIIFKTWFCIFASKFEKCNSIKSVTNCRNDKRMNSFEVTHTQLHNFGLLLFLPYHKNFRNFIDILIQRLLNNFNLDT